MAIAPPLNNRPYNLNFLRASLNPLPFLEQTIDPIFIRDVRRKLHNITNLNIIRTLEENWNDNGALPFPESLVKNCWKVIEDIIRQPKLFPTAAQTITLDYDKDNGEFLQFELFENKIEVLIVSEDGDAFEKTIPFNINLINEEVSRFYESNISTERKII